jgi:hypothetical protein
MGNLHVEFEFIVSTETKCLSTFETIILVGGEMRGLDVSPEGQGLGEMSAIWTAFPLALEYTRLIKLRITGEVSWSRVTLKDSAESHM